MTEEEHIAECHKCHQEFPEHLSMPDPETEKGDYCPDCYCDLYGDWEVKKHGKALADFLPAMEVLYAPDYATRLIGNCHIAARALVRHLNDVLPRGSGAKTQRGFWLGAIHQHSWVIVWHDNFKVIVDPTQFQFTKEEPAYAFADPEDERYDLCGWDLESGMRGAAPQANGSRIYHWPWKSRDLISTAKKRLRCHKRQRGLTAEQAHWLCHQSAKYLPRAFFAGLNRRYGAFIPMETKIYLGLQKDPDADVNTRRIPRI